MFENYREMVRQNNRRLSEAAKIAGAERLWPYILSYMAWGVAIGALVVWLALDGPANMPWTWQGAVAFIALAILLLGDYGVAKFEKWMVRTLGETEWEKGLRVRHPRIAKMMLWNV